MRMVAFTGMPGAGKTEAVKVASEQGLQVLRMGDAVWEEVRRRGLPLTAEEVGRVADEMRGTDGPDIWARRTLDAVDMSASLVVIDGLRSAAELAVFREALGEDFVLVRIECPWELRLQRITSRGRDDDTVSEEAFEARDRRELSWGLGEVLDAADRVIENTGTVEGLRAQVTDFLSGLEE